MIHRLWIRSDLAGTGHGLLEVLSLYMLEELRKTKKDASWQPDISRLQV